MAPFIGSSGKTFSLGHNLIHDGPENSYAGSRHGASGDDRFQQTIARSTQHDLRRILFFSTDDSLRSMLRAFLCGEGFTLFACDDIEYASNIFLKGSHVHLLIIDLPSLGGGSLQLASEAGFHFPGLPVIVFASPHTDECVDGLIGKRGWTLLRKPFLLPKLLGELQKIFDPDQPDRLS